MSRVMATPGSAAKPFEGGPLILIRLPPTDYHHVHFSDAGKLVYHNSTMGQAL